MKSKITKPILQEILAERKRQDDKWGEQNHPSLDQVLLNRKGGCSSERMCEEYEIPSESRAKFLCDTVFERKQGTWAHILIEEVSEVVATKDEIKRREELVQLAAVAVAWIESIDRNNKK